MAADPFGNPEGSRTDLNELNRDYVAVPSERFGSGFGTHAEATRKRVIIGAKGSGKTVYLRLLQDIASRNPAAYADSIQRDVPTTANIIKFCQAFPARQTTERWSQLWHRAILRSAVSHLLHVPSLRQGLHEGTKDRLRGFCGALYPEFESACSIYSQATHIINSHNTEHQYQKYLEHERWTALESFLQEATAELPPLYFFLDAPDDAYASAPMFWLRCQEGLLERVMYLLLDAKLGGRLHVITCFREHVFASILQGEHANRFRREPHIQRLSWTRSAIEYLFEEKIRRLPNEVLVRPQLLDASPFEAWLGTQRVYNTVRRTEERITDYLLRHTRLLPRDIVILGNVLCDESQRTATNGGSEVDARLIRRRVAESSRAFGNEQLSIASNHVTSDLTPDSAGRMEFSEFYTSHVSYRNHIRDQILEVIAYIPHERFSHDVLRGAMERAREIFDGYDNLFSVLWQTRIIGYRTEEEGIERDVFFASDGTSSFEFPLREKEYVFHSTMIDSAGVQPGPDGPAIVD